MKRVRMAGGRLDPRGFLARERFRARCGAVIAPSDLLDSHRSCPKVDDDGLSPHLEPLAESHEVTLDWPLPFVDGPCLQLPREDLLEILLDRRLLLSSWILGYEVDRNSGLELFGMIPGRRIEACSPAKIGLAWPDDEGRAAEGAHAFHARIVRCAARPTKLAVRRPSGGGIAPWSGPCRINTTSGASSATARAVSRSGSAARKPSDTCWGRSSSTSSGFAIVTRRLRRNCPSSSKRSRRSSNPGRSESTCPGCGVSARSPTPWARTSSRSSVPPAPLTRMSPAQRASPPPHRSADPVAAPVAAA